MLVVMVRLVEEEWPLPNWQLKVKTKEGLLEERILESEAPGITKLTTRGEERVEGVRETATGAKEKDERSIEGSSTDHTTTPPDWGLRSMVPSTFNLEEGLTLIGVDVDPTTVSLNEGDSEARMTVLKTLSHCRLLVSPRDIDGRPRNDTVNTSPSLTTLPLRVVEEELTLIWTREVEEDEREGAISRRPSQLSRYDGEIRKQVQSNDRLETEGATSPTVFSS
jgi:hypothetical protein